MNLIGLSLWGFIATIVMTTIVAGAQPLGLSRASLPFILGTMFTADRGRAAVIGFFANIVQGWVFAVLYALVFDYLHAANWWIGGLLGVFHSLFVLTVFMPLLPGLHPRMASELRGPQPTRELEPPGFMGLHYGRWTPVVILVAHLVYGIILGAFYRLA
jgi:hypothetical protein